MTQPTFAEAVRFWLKLGFISFGGPTGQISIMHEELVERRKWVSESQFLHALNYCMLLPGPEAQQLATYIGWLLHRTAGGILAGLFFVLPSAVLLWGLSWVYVTYGSSETVAAIFQGLKPAVTAIVAIAVVRVGKRILKNSVMVGLAGAAFVALFLFKLPFPLIILAAGVMGALGGRYGMQSFVQSAAGAETGAAVLDHGRRGGMARFLRVAAVGLGLWWAPVFLLGVWDGFDGTLFLEGIFFSKAAVVTFGGAYAVLPYVAQQAVERFGWLDAAQMLDGLGLAETTPGPLIMVVQFVGFLGGWNHPGNLPPLVAATIGSLITVWVTFVPCFLWIFLGAPYVERLRSHRGLTGALSAITAAVVGVILNLAVWFGFHVLLPAEGRFDVFALLVCVVVFFGMIRWRWGIIPVIFGAGLAGWIRTFLP